MDDSFWNAEVSGVNHRSGSQTGHPMFDSGHSSPPSSFTMREYLVFAVVRVSPLSENHSDFFESILVAGDSSSSGISQYLRGTLQLLFFAFRMCQSLRRIRRLHFRLNRCQCNTDSSKIHNLLGLNSSCSLGPYTVSGDPFALLLNKHHLACCALYLLTGTTSTLPSTMTST